MIKLTRYIAITALLFAGCSDSYVNDSKDCKVYREVKIGNRTWMAENLSDADIDGTSWCYGNNASFCTKYGRLYDWYAAMNACPSGWRLPTNADWLDLFQDVGGGKQVVAIELKSQTGWNDNGKGTNESGFSALPGGYGLSDLRTFVGIGWSGFWWSATEESDTEAYAWVIGSGYDGVEQITISPQSGLSVRCVRNY